MNASTLSTHGSQILHLGRVSPVIGLESLLAEDCQRRGRRQWAILACELLIGPSKPFSILQHPSACTRPPSVTGFDLSVSGHCSWS